MGDFPLRDLGPASVIWDPDGVNIELNPTFGGVSFRDEALGAPIKQDGHGETEYDTTHIGRLTELTAPMTDSTRAKLEAVIKGSIEGASNLVVSNKVGQSCRANAKEIIVKPMDDNAPTADTEEWLHIFLAYPFSNLEWVFDNAGQRVTNVLFKCYPQFVSTGVAWRMWRMGPA